MMNRKKVVLFVGIAVLLIIAMLVIAGFWHSEKNLSNSTPLNTQGAPSSTSTLSLDSFANIKIGTPYSAIVEQFGQPEKDIGSGLHIFIYSLSDGTQIWLGFADLNSLFYIKYQLADGTVKSIAGGN